MANKLKVFPDFRRTYDWNSLLNGTVWELKRGEDFAGNIKSFRMTAYLAALSRKMKLKTKITSKDTIVIQAYR